MLSQNGAFEYKVLILSGGRNHTCCNLDRSCLVDWDPRRLAAARAKRFTKIQILKPGNYAAAVHNVNFCGAREENAPTRLPMRLGQFICSKRSRK